MESEIELRMVRIVSNIMVNETNILRREFQIQSEGLALRESNADDILYSPVSRIAMTPVSLVQWL